MDLDGLDNVDVRPQEQVLQLESSVNERPIHFVGRAHAFLLLRHHRNDRFAAGVTKWVSRRSHVLWLAPPAKSVRLPKSVFGLKATDREFRSPLAQEGFLRAEYDLPGVKNQSPNTRQDAGDWNANAEIESVTFRYYDGSEWQSKWDSHLEEGGWLPIAGRGSC